jgi:hypothetical protein
MASVWETILQLPILPRDATTGVSLVGGPLAAKCAPIMHGREAETLTEAEVKDGGEALVNMVGGNRKALVRR